MRDFLERAATMLLVALWATPFVATRAYLMNRGMDASASALVEIVVAVLETGLILWVCHLVTRTKKG